MSDTSVQIALGKTKLNQDLGVLLADLEELLRLSATASGEGLAELRARLSARVATIRSQLGGAQAGARERCQIAAGTADEFVRSNPWQAVGIGVGVGLLLGALFAR